MAATLAARTGAVGLVVDLVVPIDVPGRGTVVVVDLVDGRVWPMMGVLAVGMVRDFEVAGVDRKVAEEANRACVEVIVE